MHASEDTSQDTGSSPEQPKRTGWSFEKEVIYTYWAAYQKDQYLGAHFKFWFVGRMKETYWDNREDAKRFGNISLLSKFLWVEDANNDG